MRTPKWLSFRLAVLTIVLAGFYGYGFGYTAKGQYFNLSGGDLGGYWYVLSQQQDAGLEGAMIGVGLALVVIGCVSAWPSVVRVVRGIAGYIRDKQP